jgi:hypothetical protein
MLGRALAKLRRIRLRLAGVKARSMPFQRPLVRAPAGGKLLFQFRNLPL